MKWLQKCFSIYCILILSICCVLRYPQFNKYLICTKCTKCEHCHLNPSREYLANYFVQLTTADTLRVLCKDDSIWHNQVFCTQSAFHLHLPQCIQWGQDRYTVLDSDIGQTLHMDSMRRTVKSNIYRLLYCCIIALYST